MKMMAEETTISNVTDHDLFRLLVENMLEGVVIVDWDTTILFANKVAAALLGFESPENLIGHKSLEFVHPDSKDLLVKTLETVKAGNSKVNNEYRFTTNKGKDVWFETCGTKIDFKGRSADLVTFSDITERKRAEKALKESEELYRKLVQTSPDAVTATDIEGRITHVSQRTLQLYKYEYADELLGKSAFDLIAPKDRERAMMNLGKTMNEGFVRNAEYTMLRKDGTRFKGEVSAALIKDTEGNPRAFIATTRDITDRKHAEEKLRENEEKFRLFFENEPEYCYMVSPEGRILDINKSALETLGYKKEEIIGKLLLPTIYAPSSRKKAEGAFRKWRETGRLKNEELTIITKNGEERTVLLSVDSVRDVYGKIIYSISVQRDITERKRAEEQIKHSLKEKEVLLKEIHHRVKNNMQIISSLLSLQSDHITDERALEMFRESQTRIRSMALIHENLYQSEDFAHIEFGEYIKLLTGDILRFYGESAQEIVLKIDAENILLGIDTAIPCGLIINELVSNSLNHAFPDGEGKITVKFSTIDENTLELVISDNGIGIPDSIDIRTTESFGLQLVTLLAEEQLEGNINLDRNGGTAIHITFKR